MEAYIRSSKAWNLSVKCPHIFWLMGTFLQHTAECGKARISGCTETLWKDLLPRYQRVKDYLSASRSSYFLWGFLQALIAKLGSIMSKTWQTNLDISQFQSSSYKRTSFLKSSPLCDPSKHQFCMRAQGHWLPRTDSLHLYRKFCLDISKWSRIGPIKFHPSV